MTIMTDYFRNLIKHNSALKEHDFYSMYISNLRVRNITFENCVFDSTSFHRVTFDECKFIKCIFKHCNLFNCSISNNTFFIETDLRGIHTYNDIYIGESVKKSINVPMVCPSEGEIIGYKKCYSSCVCDDGSVKRDYPEVIVKLLIPSDAKRSSAFSNKCRCSKARVIDILNLDGSKAATDIAISSYSVYAKPWDIDETNIYIIREVIYPDCFDENRWIECSNGIHFFMTFEEAKNYKL